MWLRNVIWKSQVVRPWFIFVVVQPATVLGTGVEPALQQVRIEELSNPILAFDIAKGSDLAAVALADLHVRVWKLSSGKVLREFSFPEPNTDQHLKLETEAEPISLHFSPDGKSLAVGFLNAIHLYDVETWAEQVILAVPGEDETRPGMTATQQRPELTPRTAEQARIESEEPVLDINQTMRKWARQRRQGDGRTRISDFAFAGGGQLLLASYCRGACWVWPGMRRDQFPSGRDPVRLWNMRSAQRIWESSYDPDGVISRVAVLPDGKRFIALDSQLGHCTVGAYDLANGQALWSHMLGACLDGQSIVVLPDGKWFITNRIEEANRKNVNKHLYRYAAIYDTSTGKKIADLPKADGISVADISPDGHWLASIIWRGTQFQIWDLQAKKIVLNELPKGWKRTADCVLNRVRFSPDNHWLVVGCSMGGDLAVYQWSEDQTRQP